MTQDVLVVYATLHGHAELVARRIAEAAPDWGAFAGVQDVRATTAADLAEHAAIIVVASVHFGRHPRSVTKFVKRHRARLEQMRTAFLSVSGDATDEATRPRAEQYVRDFVRATGWTPTESTIVAGAVKFTKYNPLLRFVIRRMQAARGSHLDPHRDYDFTNWEAVERFARAFVSGRGVKVA